MDSGRFLHATIRIGAVVDAAGQALLLQRPVHIARPFLPPAQEGPFRSPIGGGDSIPDIVSCLIPDALSLLIHHIFPALLGTPFAVFVDGPDGAENMKMRIRNAAALQVRRMDGKIHDHALADKLLLQELPSQGYILLNGQLILKGNVIAVRKLGFCVFLRPIHGVPKGFPVCELLRRMGRQKDVG